jgi:hypothetical protein
MLVVPFGRWEGQRQGPLDEVGSKLSADDIRAWIVDAKTMTAKTGATRKPEMKAYPLDKRDTDALVAYLSAVGMRRVLAVLRGVGRIFRMTWGILRGKPSVRSLSRAFAVVLSLLQIRHRVCIRDGRSAFQISSRYRGGP